MRISQETIDFLRLEARMSLEEVVDEMIYAHGGSAKNWRGETVCSHLPVAREVHHKTVHMYTGRIV